MNENIGLEVRIRIEVELRFGGDHHVFRNRSRPPIRQLQTDRFVAASPWRYRHHPPADQLELVTIRKQSRCGDALDFCHGPAPARQSLGCLRLGRSFVDKNMWFIG
jgi:hypothetical protein